ncbi:MAG: hypothetical protein OXI96_06150 [Acidimicrobiaceae bacterium]|nr:hypothetical protein [Acidimicrobiaceae bacterium]
MSVSDCTYDPPDTISFADNVKIESADPAGLDIKFANNLLPTRNSRHVLGAPPDDATPFVWGHSSLQTPLDSFVKNTNYFSAMYGNYGTMKIIGHIGAQRDRLRCDVPNRDSYVHCQRDESDPAELLDLETSAVLPQGSSINPSFHYHGKALDITWIYWDNHGVPIYCLPYDALTEAEDVTTHRRLIAVEAGLRKWFGYVLNRGISNHHNHFHVDNDCPVALRLKDSSSSRTHTSCHFFMQDCIYAFTDEKIAYDGDWGPKSKHGCKTLLSDFGMECLNPAKYVSHYMLFLDYVMMHGFADAPAGTYRWGDSALVV